MKKLQILTLSMILSISCMMHAELVNGFSDLQAKNPRDKQQRVAISDARIAEEMGEVVSVQSFTDFLNLTQKYIKNISKRPSQKQLQTVVKAVIDLFRAYKQLDENDQSEELQNRIDQIKARALQLRLPGQLKNLLQSMAQ